MTSAIFTIVLAAALLHAAWNAIVKSGTDKLLTTVLVTGCAALVALAGLPFLPAPAPASWPFIAGSSVLQIVYFGLIARTYRVADMSLAYPLMRGTAPLLVAAASLLWLDQHLAPAAWLGIALVCAGVLSMAVGLGTGARAGLSLALLNAVVIAGYTLVDGIGVRRSGAAAAYTLWIFLFTGAALTAWAAWARRDVFSAYARQHWRRGMTGGVGTVVSYGLALWAMTMAPVAVISALRETSILFATAISVWILGERVSRSRIVAVCLIAAGAMVLRGA